MEKQHLLVLAFPHLLSVAQVWHVCLGASRAPFHLNNSQLQLISLLAVIWRWLPETAFG